MKLSELTENIFVMNLLSRPDRLGHFKEQMDKFNFRATICDAVDGSTLNNPTRLRNGEYGLIQTYKKIIQYCKDSEMPTALIFEDDATFVDDLEVKLEVYKNIPDDWDFIMLGSNQYFLGAGGYPPEKIADNILKCHTAYCAHAILWKSSMYDKILEMLSHECEPIDVTFTRLQIMFNCYAIYPSVCYQYDSDSSILGFNPGYNQRGVFTSEY